MYHMGLSTQEGTPELWAEESLTHATEKVRTEESLGRGQGKKAFQAKSVCETETERGNGHFISSAGRAKEVVLLLIHFSQSGK